MIYCFVLFLAKLTLIHQCGEAIGFTYTIVLKTFFCKVSEPVCRRILVNFKKPLILKLKLKQCSTLNALIKRHLQ